MRRIVIAAAAAATLACGPAPQPAQQPKPAVEQTTLPWYRQSTEELAAFNRQAEELFQDGQFQQAAAIIGQTQPLADKLLTVSRPTLEAMEATSDHDALYGRMLLHNGQIGWARMTFQKNVVRWRAWKPQTPETEARAKAAADAVADCDKRM